MQQSKYCISIYLDIKRTNAFWLASYPRVQHAFGNRGSVAIHLYVTPCIVLSWSFALRSSEITKMLLHLIADRKTKSNNNKTCKTDLSVTYIKRFSGRVREFYFTHSINRLYHALLISILERETSSKSISEIVRVADFIKTSCRVFPH